MLKSLLFIIVSVIVLSVVVQAADLTDPLPNDVLMSDLLSCAEKDTSGNELISFALQKFGEGNTNIVIMENYSWYYFYLQL